MRKFYSIFGFSLEMKKYECSIIKHSNTYKYDIKISDKETNILYLAHFKFNEYTGNAYIYNVIDISL